MKIQLTSKYILSFLSLTFVMYEAHEIIHTSVGRLICGCWGVRDFNAWEICENCDNPLTILATIAGPIFTFIMIWIGSFLLNKQNSDEKKAIGISLIFANMPFGRIFNPIFGGGDEAVVINNCIHDFNTSKHLALILIIIICAYPLYKAFITIQNKKRMGWFLLFLLVPFIIDLLVILGVMNTLLSNGILADYWILGSPKLVTLWTLLVTITFILTRKYLLQLIKQR